MRKNVELASLPFIYLKHDHMINALENNLVSYALPEDDLWHYYAKMYSRCMQTLKEKTRKTS